MKKVCLVFLFILVGIFGLNFNITYADDNYVYLGGMPAGFCIDMKGAYVAGLCDVITDDGLISPSKTAQIERGDIILSIDGIEVNNALDVEKTLTDFDEKTLKISRNGQILYKTVKPAKDLNGKGKLGVFIREGINGIGTITYIKNNRYASLGHPVLGDNNEIINILGGKLYNCTITGLIKGESGKAGELHGAFLKNKVIGSVEKNIESGVYGKLEDYDYSTLTKIEIGNGKVGDASIFTTIDGNTPKEYKISIIKVDESENVIKNYVIKIIDETLLDKTNGILQGMSGSPIVQDGKLIGAVTHVFINDPCRGFGISLDNMINN